MDELSENVRALALAIWQEQLASGLGEPGEQVAEEALCDWLANREYPVEVLAAAAAGDAAALFEVRREAGLPVFS